MTLLTPLIAGIAAAIAIPTLVILYFLKLRRRDLEVSTTLLWRKAIEDLQANAPFQKLRNNILLYLQLLVLALALLAVGQPQVQSDLVAGTMHVILIDTSASMNATDGNLADRTTRLETAKSEALALVDALREPGLVGESGDKAMLITFDSGASVRQNFTSSKQELRTAIKAIEGTDSSTSIREAVKLAKAYSPRQQVEDKGLLSSGAPTIIHIFSDGGIAEIGTDNASDAKFDITAEDKVLYHPIGATDAGNVGITGLRADRAFDRPSQLQIFVGLQSTFRTPRSVDVEVAIDGQIVGIKGKTLTEAQRRSSDGRSAPPSGGGPGIKETLPEGSAIPPAPEPAKDPAAVPAPPPPSAEPALTPALDGLVFTLDRPDGGIVTVRLIHPSDAAGTDLDVLPTDDLGYISVPPAKRLAVAFVTAGNLFVREALEGLNLSRLEVIAPTDAQAFFNSRRPEEFDLFVLDRWLPTIKPGPGAPAGSKPAPGLPPGRSLVFGIVPPPPLGLVDKGTGEATVVLDWVRNHPVMRNVGFESVVINPGRLTTLAEKSPVTVLATAQGGPAIIETADEASRAVIVAFDVTASNWPFEPGFVLFTAASLSYLASDGNVTAAMVRPGETIADRVPLSAKNITMGLPDKSISDLVASADGRIVFGPVRKTGVYTLSWEGTGTATDVVVSGRPRRAVTANLLDPIESNAPARPTAILATGKVETVQGGASKGLRRLWPFLLMGALAVMLFEWWVYNRKVVL
ncbi:MAG: vWA domain-containing protein [Phycisphaerales bacterium]